MQIYVCISGGKKSYFFEENFAYVLKGSSVVISESVHPEHNIERI